MTDKQQIIEEMVDAMIISCGECYSCQFSGKTNNRVSCTDYLTAEALYNAWYRRVPEKAVVLTKQEKEKLLHEMYEQGKFDAIALLTNGSMQSKVESSMKDLLDKINGYLAKGEDYCGSLGPGLLAAKMIIALYCKEHNLEVE